MTGDGAAEDELARLAVALTGDPRAAAELLGAVAVLRPRAGGGEGGGEGGEEDGEARTPRTLLVQQFLHRRTARDVDGTAGTGTPVPPAGRPPPPELRAVLERLAGLSPLARAVLVLRVDQRLTLHELAGLVDRPLAAVHRTLEQAERAVAADPGTVVAALARLPGVDPLAVRAATERAARRRRRRRGRTALAAAVALVLLVTAAVVPGLVRERGNYLRPYGAWVHGFDLDAGPGWRTGARTLTAGRDSLVVHRTDDSRRCLVDLVVSRTPLTVPDGDRETLRGRPAAVVPSRDAAAPYLWWSLDTRTAAVIGCSAPGSDVLLDLARRVRLRAVPVRLPFALPPLDDGLSVRYVAVGDSSLVALALPPGRVSRAAGTAYISVPGSSRLPEDPRRRVRTRVQGVTGTLDSGRTGGLTLCWPVQQSRACVSASVFRERSDPDQTRLRRQLSTLAQGVTFAPSVADGATWFDARDALPG